MKPPKFKSVGYSVTSPIDHKIRKVLKTKIAPVCWTGDFQKEIRVQGGDRYFHHTTLKGDVIGHEQHYISYALNLIFSTTQILEIEMRLYAIPDVDAIREIANQANKSDPKVVALLQRREVIIREVKSRCERGVEQHLNNKLQLEISDPICGKKTVPIKIKIKWVDSAEACHFIYKIFGKEIRANVTGNVLSIHYLDDEHTQAHEIAHCLGLPDEYSDLKENEELRYRRPDGALGNPLPVWAVDVDFAPEVTSIMSTGYVVEPHHGWPFAIESQELLSEKLQRIIRCDISLA